MSPSDYLLPLLAGMWVAFLLAVLIVHIMREEEEVATQARRAPRTRKWGTSSTPSTATV